MITGLVVLKIVLMPSRQRLASLANSGPRWSIIGVSMARSTRSGSGVGPGMCRKCRPIGREEFFAIAVVPCARALPAGYLVGLNYECDSRVKGVWTNGLVRRSAVAKH